jgi:hypothetical protein
MNDLNDNVTINACSFGVSTLVAIATSNVIYLKIGLRASFFFLFLSSSCGGLLILVWGYNSDSDALFAVLVVMASFGVVACFNLVYASHSATFPTLFSGTAMGICNFAARVATIFAPLVAKIDGPTSMYIFTTLTGIACLLSLFLKKAEDEQEEGSQVKDAETVHVQEGDFDVIPAKKDFKDSKLTA